MRLLLAEDEKDLSDVLKQVLEMSGYDVDVAFDGEEALYYAENKNYDGVILDWMMPKKDGVQTVKAMRAKGIGVPVLMLTAKSETDDKITGLDAGADDYLTKPFVMKELLARVRALTRRKGEMLTSCSFCNLTLNADSFEIQTSYGKKKLTNKEYKLMEYLIRNHNVILSTERILANVWEFDSDAEINVVWVFISSLRKKMKEIGADCIITASRGVGYRLEKIDD